MIEERYVLFLSTVFCYTKAMKEKTIFVCSNCGNEFAAWSGRCEVCGEWNALREVKVQNSKFKAEEKKTSLPQTLKEIKTGPSLRIKTGIEEFDRALGGGLVKGSVVLLGGDPGIGKSTLLLDLSRTLKGKKILYVSGEESPSQLKIRAERLKVSNPNLKIFNSTDVNQIIETARDDLDILIIDSIQTIYHPDFPSTPGSLVQVRESALALQRNAKNEELTTILVGHVTKEGSLAGPRVLEHLVDVLLYLEGEDVSGTRILRAVKNRFGSTEEIGIFEMTETGLKEVKDPSKYYLSESKEKVAGTCVTAVVEGSRVYLIEVQALTSATVFGYPKRASVGFDLNRLSIIIAILLRRANLNLLSHDVYINISGGMRIRDTAADLAVALAIASAFTGKKVKDKICAFGELGLSGAIRKAPREEGRTKEAKRLGYDKILKVKNLKEALKEGLED